MTIISQSYIDNFKNLLFCIDDSQDGIKRYELAIASEHNAIRELTEQQSKLRAEIAETKEEFEEKFVELFRAKSNSLQTSLCYGKMNLYISFFGKNYYLFDNALKFYGEPEEILSTIASIIVENLSNVTFNQTVKELSDLYAKYEVSPDFIKHHLLKITNGRRIKELEKLVAEFKTNLMFNESSLKYVQSQLSNRVLQSTLFNKIFHKKQLMLQDQEKRLLDNNAHWKGQIDRSEKIIEEIKQNPNKSMPHIETELKNLSDFLDIYELIKLTQCKVYHKQVKIADIDTKIDAKKGYIASYNKDIESLNSRILDSDNEISKLCEKLSKDKLCFEEINENANNETVKRLLEYYDKHIESLIEQIL